MQANSNPTTNPMTKATAAPTVAKNRNPAPMTPKARSPLNAAEIPTIRPTHARNMIPLTPPRQAARAISVSGGTDVHGATVKAPRSVRFVDQAAGAHKDVE